MFDPKIAYSRVLHTLPVSLDEKIDKNEVDYQDIVFRRYKTLLIPIDSLLSSSALMEIVEYFMRYSTIIQVENR